MEYALVQTNIKNATKPLPNTKDDYIQALETALISLGFRIVNNEEFPEYFKRNAPTLYPGVTVQVRGGIGHSDDPENPSGILVSIRDYDHEETEENEAEDIYRDDEGELYILR